MAKIVIDARESGTSTGRYVDKLVEHLHKLESEHKFIIITRPERVGYISSVAPNFLVVRSKYKEFTFGEQLGFKWQVRRQKADLVHFAITQQPILYHGKVVTTIHDLTTTRFTNPDKNPAVFKLKQQIYKIVIKRVARKSKVIITPSRYVKNDLVDFTRIKPDKVSVIYEAAEIIAEPAKTMTDLLGKHFLLYVGRPTPHKNLSALVDAFALLKGKYPKLKLVLAGKNDANFRRLRQEVGDKAVENVVFTGYVTDGQLKWLYESCDAYVFPSLSEGFGLPGLEAMAHRAVVVSSKATCLPEIYGSAARYFDPLNSRNMADVIDDVLSKPELRNELLTESRQQVAKYSWASTARQTLNLYNRILKD